MIASEKHQALAGWIVCHARIQALRRLGPYLEAVQMPEFLGQIEGGFVAFEQNNAEHDVEFLEFLADQAVGFFRKNARSSLCSNSGILCLEPVRTPMAVPGYLLRIMSPIALPVFL